MTIACLIRNTLVSAARRDGFRYAGGPMILALLIVAAEPQTAIDAERAFAADAQKLGQWTAFRKWAADGCDHVSAAGRQARSNG